MSYIFEHFFGIQTEYGTLRFWKEIKYRARFREPTNLKYLTTVGTKGNAVGDRWENDRRRTEIGREIWVMYLGNVFGLKSNGRERWNREKTKLENLLTSNIQLLQHRGQLRWGSTRAMYQQRWKTSLSRPKIKWSGKMKSRDKETATEIKAMFEPQMKWKWGNKSREMKNATI